MFYSFLSYKLLDFHFDQSIIWELWARKKISYSKAWTEALRLDAKKLSEDHKDFMWKSLQRKFMITASNITILSMNFHNHQYHSINKTASANVEPLFKAGLSSELLILWTSLWVHRAFEPWRTIIYFHSLLYSVFSTMDILIYFYNKQYLQHT